MSPRTFAAVSRSGKPVAWESNRMMAANKAPAKATGIGRRPSFNKFRMSGNGRAAGNLFAVLPRETREGRLFARLRIATPFVL